MGQNLRGLSPVKSALRTKHFRKEKVRNCWHWVPDDRCSRELLRILLFFLLQLCICVDIMQKITKGQILKGGTPFGKTIGILLVNKDMSVITPNTLSIINYFARNLKLTNNLKPQKKSFKRND